MIIFFDLWLTVRNPFYDREKRVKYYWAILSVQLVIVSFVIMHEEELLNNKLISNNEDYIII